MGSRSTSDVTNAGLSELRMCDPGSFWHAPDVVAEFSRVLGSEREQPFQLGGLVNTWQCIALSGGALLGAGAHAGCLQAQAYRQCS